MQDAFNRVIAQVDALNGRTTFVYDDLDRRVNYIDPVGNKTTFVYDALNREIEQIDPRGESTTFAYDARGYRVSVTDRLGRRRDFTFDAVGQKSGEAWINVGGSTANLLTFTYDAVGNQLTARDDDGTYTMTYDVYHCVSVVNDPLGQTLTFTYDALSRRTVVQDSQGGHHHQCLRCDRQPDVSCALRRRLLQPRRFQLQRDPTAHHANPRACHGLPAQFRVDHQLHV